MLRSSKIFSSWGIFNSLKRGATNRGLDGLKKRDQLRNPLLCLMFIATWLVVKATTPHWHVARTVSLNFLTSIYVTGNSILGQRVPHSFGKPSEVRRRRGQRSRHRTVALAGEPVTGSAVLQIERVASSDLARGRVRGRAC
jgi:hypothetical protein